MTVASAVASTQRLDVWIHNARFAKTRSIALALIQRGKVRVNKKRMDKASCAVRLGDVLTLSLGPRVLVIEVVRLGYRRGPADEARQLYRELTAAPDRTTSERVIGNDASGASGAAQGLRLPGTGRPTKRERRDTDRLRNRFGES